MFFIKYRFQDKVSNLLTKVRKGKTDYNKIIQNKKEFRNPSIYEKLIDHLGLDEMGSNYPLVRLKSIKIILFYLHGYCRKYLILTVGERNRFTMN